MKPVPHQEIRGRADRVAVLPDGRGAVSLAAYVTGEDNLIYRVEMTLTPEAAAHIRSLLPDEAIPGAPVPATTAAIAGALWTTPADAWPNLRSSGPASGAATPS